MTEMQIEIIGFTAMILTVIGFMSNSIRVVRMWSSISCLFWVLYGYMLGSPSIIIMNFIIAILHAYKQHQFIQKAKRENAMHKNYHNLRK